MASRRHLALSLSFSVDNDAVLAERSLIDGDGDTPFDDAVNEFRTCVHAEAERIFEKYGLDITSPEVHYQGISARE